MTETIGSYELVERIAVGGVAQIFRARRTDGRGGSGDVAVKVLLAKYEDSEEHRHMMRDEAQICAQLDHPNIVKIRELGEDGSRIFLVMDFVEGTDLTGVLNALARRGSAVPLDIATHIAMEVCSGLHYAHTFRSASGEPLQLVHRDVSPHNVLLSRDGQVKLIDFGVAKTSMRGRMETRTGIIKGKLTYMAPEYAIGTLQDPRSDVFAAGLCLYEMVTGQPAYGQQDPQQLVRAVKFADIPPASNARPDLPGDLESVIFGALQQQPSDRFQSAQQMHQALAGVMRRLAPGFQRGRVARWLTTVIEPAPSPPAVERDIPTDQTDLRDDDFAELRTQALATPRPSDDDDAETLGRDNAGPRIPRQVAARVATVSQVADEDSDASLATAQLTDTAFRRALASRNADESLDETGPLESAELAGFADLKDISDDAAEDIAVLQTMALEEGGDLPPLHDRQDSAGVGDDISEDMIAAMPTATDIDVNEIRGDAAERNGAPNQPQILTQSGFQRFLSADQIEAFRSPSQAPTKRTSPLEEWTDRDLENLGADRPTLPHLGDSPDESDIGPTKQTEQLSAAPTESFAYEVTEMKTDRHVGDFPNAFDDDGPATLPATNAAQSVEPLTHTPEPELESDTATLPGDSSAGASNANGPTTLPARPIDPSPQSSTDTSGQRPAAAESRNMPHAAPIPAPRPSPQQQQQQQPQQPRAQQQPQQRPAQQQPDDRQANPGISAHAAGQSPQEFPIQSPRQPASPGRSTTEQNTGPIRQQSTDGKSERRRRLDIVVVAALAVFFVGMLVYVLFLAD